MAPFPTGPNRQIEPPCLSCPRWPSRPWFSLSLACCMILPHVDVVAVGGAALPDVESSNSKGGALGDLARVLNDDRVRKVRLTRKGLAERAVLDSSSNELAASILTPLTEPQRDRARTDTSSWVQQASRRETA